MFLCSCFMFLSSINTNRKSTMRFPQRRRQENSSGSQALASGRSCPLLSPPCPSSPLLALRSLLSPFPFPAFFYPPLSSPPFPSSLVLFPPLRSRTPKIHPTGRPIRQTTQTSPTILEHTARLQIPADRLPPLVHSGPMLNYVQRPAFHNFSFSSI